MSSRPQRRYGNHSYSMQLIIYNLIQDKWVFACDSELSLHPVVNMQP